MKLQRFRKDRQHFNRKETIIEICKKHFYPYDIFEDMHRRKRELVFRRFVTMYLLRKFTKLSLAEIGFIFGKDHATALHGYRTISDYMDIDPETQSIVVPIRNEIIKVLDVIDETEASIHEQLIYYKEMNKKLIDRDLYRKQQLILARKDLRLVPDKYIDKIKKSIETCMSPL